MKGRKWRKGERSFLKPIVQMTMKCFCSGEQFRANEMIQSANSQTTKDCSTSKWSSQNGEGERRFDNCSIEEAESSLREGVCLNYEVGPSFSIPFFKINIIYWSNEW